MTGITLMKDYGTMTMEGELTSIDKYTVEVEVQFLP